MREASVSEPPEMEIVALEDTSASRRGAVVTIGAYDGVHLGHQAVLRLVRELATARGSEAVCLTFDRHPAEVVRPESRAEAAHHRSSRRSSCSTRPASSTARACSPSTRRAATSRPRTSSREVLVERLGARLVIVGADFHFGYRRHGTVRLLEQMGAELGFEVLGLGLVPVEGDAERPCRTRRPRSGGSSARAESPRRPASTRARPGPHEVRGDGRER